MKILMMLLLSLSSLAKNEKAIQLECRAKYILSNTSAEMDGPEAFSFVDIVTDNSNGIYENKYGFSNTVQEIGDLWQNFSVRVRLEDLEDDNMRGGVDFGYGAEWTKKWGNKGLAWSWSQPIEQQVSKGPGLSIQKRVYFKDQADVNYADLFDGALSIEFLANENKGTRLRGSRVERKAGPKNIFKYSGIHWNCTFIKILDR